MATLFLRRRLKPSFQKLTLSRITTRFSFSVVVAGIKSSAFKCRLGNFLFIGDAAPYLSLILGSIILYSMSTMTFATMISVARTIVVPIIMV